MKQIELKLEDVKRDLKSLKLKKEQTIVWKSFPYNKNNLEIIRSAISTISTNNEYRITYDENVIFVEKDIWP